MTVLGDVPNWNCGSTGIRRGFCLIILTDNTMESERGIHFCGNEQKGIAEREGRLVHSKIKCKVNHKFMSG